jgi:hypothetical protein
VFHPSSQEIGLAGKFIRKTGHLVSSVVALKAYARLRHFGTTWHQYFECTERVGSSYGIVQLAAMPIERQKKIISITSFLFQK